MNILLIPDKFKESLRAYEVIKAIKKGLSRSKIPIDYTEIIASDGGDGFIEAIAENKNVNLVNMMAFSPLGKLIPSIYAIDLKEKTAYIELAKASGLSLLLPKDRNVLKTSTFGTGMQIKAAVAKGATKIYIGLGGSATNDAGTGIAVALGYKFLDTNDKELDPCGENLIKIDSIIKPVINDFNEVQFVAVNDVKNVLFGLNGAAQTYAPQKGASPSDVKLLDRGLKHLSEKVKAYLNLDLADISGAGAAGGAAYGLKAFFNAGFISGIDFILNRHTSLQYFKPEDIDFIITGEGKLDSQTLHGKLVYGVADWAKKHQIPVIAVCGINTLSNQSARALNLLQIIEISDSSKSLDYNMKNAAKLLEKALFEFFKHYKP
jgi:glycerate 2-kinase